MTQAPFWYFEIGVVMQSLATFLPALWIPSFSLAIGLPKFTGPTGLALLNLAGCVGAIAVGVLVDRFHISIAIAITTVGQMIALFVFWGLTVSQSMLFVFAVVWGLFGGSYSATWYVYNTLDCVRLPSQLTEVAQRSGYAAAMKRRDPNANVDMGLVVALMAGKPPIDITVSPDDNAW